MSLKDKMQAATQSNLVPIKKQMDEARALQTEGPKRIEAATKALEAKMQTLTDDLATTIEPMAQAMVAIQESAQETVRQSAEAQAKQGRQMTGQMKEVIGQFKSQAEELAEAERSVINSVNRAEVAAMKMERSGKAIRLKFLVLCLLGGVILGTAAGIGSWTLLKHQYISQKIETAWPGNQKTQDIVKGAFK